MEKVWLGENFNESTTSILTGGTGMPTGYSTGNYLFNSGTWAFTYAEYNKTALQNNSSPYSCQLSSSVASNIISPTIISGGIGTVTFYAMSNTAGGSVNVSYQIKNTFGEVILV